MRYKRFALLQKAKEQSEANKEQVQCQYESSAVP